METTIVAVTVLVIIFTGILYRYLARNSDYWTKIGVSGPKPFPVVGNIWKVICYKMSIGVFLKNLYNSFDEPFVGFFIFNEPCILLRSPEIIKNVLSTDHKYFQDRAIANSRFDISCHTIFSAKDTEWKNTRSNLSPEFSSAKLNAMFDAVDERGKRIAKFLKRNPGNYDAKKICRKYSIDVIARCFFGVNAHSFDDVESELEQIANAMFDFTWRNSFSQTMYFFKSSMVDLMCLQFFERRVQNFFISMWDNIIKQRSEQNIYCNDLIATLKNNKNSFVTDNGKEAALCMEFFAAGFQAAASTLAFTFYEMAVNPDIQEKLRKEILSKVNKAESITEDKLNEMKYLSMCVMETQRKYPSLPFLDRRCNMDYLVPDTNLLIKKGVAVYVSTIALQTDEKYFSEPQKYEPNRFLQTVNEEKLIYLPFGYGPRTCVGKRFGLLLVKLGLVHVLMNFHVEKSPDTPDSIAFEPSSFTTQSTVGLPVRFTEIVRSSID